MRRKRSWPKVAGLLTIAALVAVACGGDDDDEATASTENDGTTASASTTEEVDDLGLGEEVLAAAREEGTVVNVGALAGPTFEELKRVFLERYGVEAVSVNVSGSEGSERIRTEDRNGNQTADTIGMGNVSSHNLSLEGLIQEYFPPEAEGNMLFEPHEGSNAFPLAINVYGFGINTSVIPEEDWPTSWADLSEPGFDAPILVYDPAAGSAGFTWFVDMLNAPGFGEDYLRTLGGLDQVEVGGVGADNLARLARGDVGLYIPYSSQDIPELEGAGVEFVVPEDGPVIVHFAGGLVKDAPHPNAGKLWLAFLLSEDGQEILSQNFQAPVRAGVAAARPEFDLNVVEPLIIVPQQEYLDGSQLLDDGYPAELGL